MTNHKLINDFKQTPVFHSETYNMAAKGDLIQIVKSFIMFFCSLHSKKNISIVYLIPEN